MLYLVLAALFAYIGFVVLRGAPRKVGKHPALSAPYKPQGVVLTPLMAERVNEARYRFGSEMLNDTGFLGAIACASPLAPTMSRVDWLTFLILFELDDDSGRSSVAASIRWCIFIRPTGGVFDKYTTIGRATHWSVLDPTPARALAHKIARETPVTEDPYADIASSIYGKR